MIALILTRWRLGLSIFAALALMGLVLTANHYRHAYNAEKALRQADRANYTAAQVEAGRLAREALANQEAAYQTKAKDADHDYQIEIADTRSAVDRYIASHRVRAEAIARPASDSVASAESGSAGVREGLPTDGVMVSESDVQACTGATAYAVKLREWALGL